MAEIETSLVLRDRASLTLVKITAGYDELINRMAWAAHAMESASPGRPFQEAGKHLENATEQVEQLGRESSNAAQAASGLQSAWSGVEAMVKGVLGMLDAKKAVELTLGGAMDLDAMEREFQARLGDDTLGSGLFAHLQQQARGSAFSLEDLAQSTSSFMAMTTNPKQLDGLNALAEKLAIFDDAGQGLAGAGASLKEAMSGDIGSLAERFHIPEAQIRDLGIDELGKQGDIDGFIRQFEKLLDLQNMGSDAYEKMFQSPKVQLANFLSNLKTGFADAGRGALDALAPLLTRLNEWFASDQAQQFFAVLSNTLQMIGNTAVSLFDTVSANWDTVGPVLLGGIAAIAAMALFSGITAAAAWLAAAAPILLIVGLIAALILGLYNAGVSFQQMGQWAGAVLGGLYAFGYNLIADIWNFLAVFAEFFANLFNDPVNAISRLLFGLADSVLGLLETIANAIDAVFDSHLGETVSKWRTGLGDMVKETIGDPENPIKRMEHKDVGASAEEGRRQAEKLLENVEGLAEQFDVSAWMGSSGTSPGGMIPEVGSVGEVGRINNDVNISEEDLKLMKDVAEMRYVQNLVTLTPSVAMNATINNGADLDAIMDGVERRLEEQFVSTAEGVLV